MQGEKGEKGNTGDTGPTGMQGEKGEKGNTGDTGPTGMRGEKGEKGNTGDTGPTGMRGENGEKGNTGDTGPTGMQGENGEKGNTGDTGPTGMQGERGEKGNTGDTGPTGIQGEKGEKGNTGDKGPTGPTGPPNSNATRIILTNDTTTPTGYISYSSTTNTAVGLRTNNSLIYDATTATLSVTNINSSTLNNYVLKNAPVITNNLTLPTTYTNPQSGELGYQFFGINNYNPFEPSDGTSTGSTRAITLNVQTSVASVALPTGVWILNGTVWIWTAAALSQFFLSISGTNNSLDKTSRIFTTATSNPGNIQLSTTRAVTATAPITFYLVIQCSTSLNLGTTAPYLASPVFYATRIA
jgi:hypothetical protein